MDSHHDSSLPWTSAEHELADEIERRNLAAARRKRQRTSIDRENHPGMFRRLIATMPEESVVNRELHAANIIATICSRVGCHTGRITQ